MGKKLYTKENISKAETERLGIPELVVLKTNSDDVGLEVVHRRYFEDEKLRRDLSRVFFPYCKDK